MQVTGTPTLYTRAAQFAKATATTVQNGATAATNWGGRVVVVIKDTTASLGHTLLNFVKAIAAYATKFFASASSTVSTFVSSQPYVAVGVGLALAVVAILAARRFRATATV